MFQTNVAVLKPLVVYVSIDVPKTQATKFPFCFLGFKFLALFAYGGNRAIELG